MKILSKIIVVVILVGGVITIPILKYKSVISNPIKSEGDIVTINANKGTFSGVMAQNEDSFNGITFIKIYNKLNKVSISVKQGVYDMPSDLSLSEVIEALETGKYNRSIVKVTIPEGYTIEQIAETLDEKEIINKEEFIQACVEYDLPEYIIYDSEKRYNLEGYLFPDTYEFEKGVSGDEIIRTMLSRFEYIIKELGGELNTDIEDIVIRASIIEREVSKEDEKVLVSSVINNRLEKNMKLQIDATVLYAIGEHKDKLYYSDLEIKSKYNTYDVSGLPIGAISNPGKDSLYAALNPLDTDYIYYMTKDGVNHKFFETYSEFLKYKNT